MVLTLEESRVKKLLKDAVAEALADQRELLRLTIEETIEDLGLLRAIKEGKSSGPASRQEVFRALGRRR